MTIDELIQYDATLDGWYLNNKGRIRRVGKDGNTIQCPITAVSCLALGQLFIPTEYNKAGKALGLSEDDCLTIANAADLANAGTPDIRTTRNKLLNALGL